MKRREFFKIGSIAAVGTVVGCANNIGSPKYKSFKQKLPIPPKAKYTLDNGVKLFKLNIQEGEVSFFKGNNTTSTYGINAPFLGETIVVNDGDKVRLDVTNNLDETTTLHWHGIRVDGNNDGGPHSIIETGKKWRANINIDQFASTCWYHAHTHMQTGRQVYMGLAGLFIVNDSMGDSLPLPKAYGIDDIPLVIQDRRFFADSEFMYKRGMHDTMMGVTGNVHLINGAIDPYVELEPKNIRFRVLNGSNARIYNLALEGAESFHQIAGDSSLLPTPVELRSVTVAPGERIEIVADFSKFAGKELYLYDNIDNRRLLKIKIKNSTPQAESLPEKMLTVDGYENAKPVNKRVFTLNMMMGFLGINGKRMDMNRIDEKVKKDTFEIWEIENPSPRPHPFHVHGTGFKILSRDNSAPLINETGLKDTVLVYPRERVRILVVFRKLATEQRPYMYHCHILEHEDAGMMGQFTVS